MEQPQDNNKDPWQGAPPDQMPCDAGTSRRFRWGWIWIPLTCLLFAWLSSGVKTGFAWEDVMAALNVRSAARYTRLAILGVVLVALTAVWRICREGRDDK